MTIDLAVFKMKITAKKNCCFYRRDAQGSNTITKTSIPQGTTLELETYYTYVPLVVIEA